MGRETQKLTRGTIAVTIRDDGSNIGIRWASLVGAVANSEAEVVVFAQAGDISCGAAQSCRLTKHVVDASLLQTRSVRKMRMPR